MILKAPVGYLNKVHKRKNVGNRFLKTFLTRHCDTETY